MARDELFVERCRRLTLEEPARALVYLWCHLQEQGGFEAGFRRPECESQAAEALEALLRGEEPPRVHPVAALSACDEFLAALDRRRRTRPRRIRREDAEEFYVLPRREDWTSRHAEQPGNLGFWMRRHQVIPAQHRGISIELRPLSRRLARRLEVARLPFTTGGFLDNVLPDWNESSPYRCSRLKDVERRWRSVVALLEKASRRGAVLVVFPELTVDSEILRRLRRWLHRERRHHGFSLVVAGSFHEDGNVDGGGHEPRRNVSSILDAFGREVFRHTKIRPFRTSKGEAFEEEDIEGSTHVELLQLGFGLVGVALCLDFCEEAETAVERLWSAVGPALMIVPSMGGKSTINAHERKARLLARQHGTATVVASQHPKENAALGLFWDADQELPDRETPAFHGQISTRK